MVYGVYGVYNRSIGSVACLFLSDLHI